MAILLGIDTGGTYTDAALLDDGQGVIRSAKALTTKHDLSIGIRRAVAAALPDRPPEIHLVSLSTTLATNAVVEGEGSPICLLLLGYPSDALDRAGLRQALGDDPVVFINGGHDVTGEEQMPLDLEDARQAILAHAPKVAAFAISGYFAVRNPAHELAVRSLVRQLTGLPVTCGHELTSHLDAPRRALTVVLNARLIPLLHHLILAVRDMLAELEIRAPLMMVKGDGSLVEAQVALERPVETVLSGPAASVVGARYLSGAEDVFVVDMGGTTTDIALLRNGHLVLNVDGATVGGWRTMVQAVSVHTSGLGGDSEVRLDGTDLIVGPRRIVPLSLLAHQYPTALETLRQQRMSAAVQSEGIQFALRQRTLDNERDGLSPTQLEIWEALAQGPVSLAGLFADHRRAHFLKYALAHLVERGLVVLGGFTPTDAAHVLEYQRDWSTDAAWLGAELWARYLAASPAEWVGTAHDFCQRVVEQVTLQAGRALVAAALAESHGVHLDGQEVFRRLFVDHALTRNGTEDSLVDVSLTLRRPLVAIGAPVSTYYPGIAGCLHTQLRIPPHAEIANAVGAVAGGIMQTVCALIKPLGLDGFRVHLPTGTYDFTNLEEAATYATGQADQLAQAQARRAGAMDVQVQTRREDRIHRSEKGDVYLDTEIIATAVGRPRLAGESRGAEAGHAAAR